MDEKKFNEILHQMNEEFSKHIMEDLYNFHCYDETTGFLESKMYSENFFLQKYFELRGETYIQNYLLNDMICTGLEQNKINIERCYLIYRENAPEKFETTNTFERRAGLEFIIDEGNKRIGVRYSLMSENDLSTIKKYNIDELIIIDRDSYHTKDIAYNEYDRDAIYLEYPCRVIGLGYFMFRYFGKENAVQYVKVFKKTIHDYLQLIGVSSLSRLTPAVLSEFRINKENVLTSKASQISSFFKSFFEDENPIYQRYKERFPDAEIKRNLDGNGYKVFMEKELNEDDYKTLEQRTRDLFQHSNVIEEFFDKKYYKILVGKSDIAKCFLTSEFLFSQYNGNDLIDYTSIISGYVKSIEQLMFKIIVAAVFNGDPEKFGDQETTMDTLCKFFKHNSKIVQSQYRGFRRTLKDCLFCYKKECRNNNFHKHNIYNWEQVKTIRENTLILYIMLFGGCYLGKDDEEIKNKFQIVDDKLERIYTELRKIPLKISEFYVKPKGKDYSVKCSRKIETSFPKYDQYGFLMDFSIRFECVDEKYPELIHKTITITRENIPDEIAYFWDEEPEWLEY